MQDFESELFAMGVDHSQKVKATPIASGYGSKDWAFLPDPTPVSRIIQESLRFVKKNPLFLQTKDVVENKRATIEASDSIMKLGDSMESLPQVIFSFGR